ncbi:MAG: adenosylmethionine decarboxylase [Deltaproteobacteria bacterium]|nr:adenosylmethionine decarboxylase [Deltaproteobacteria bacterium]
MKPMGTQILAEFFNCSRDILNDHSVIERILREGIAACNLTMVSLSSHCYEPIGITSIAVISESHVAVHTYPEARHVSLDIFTCSRSSQATRKLLLFLQEKMRPGTTRIVEMSRGNPIDVVTTNWITDDNSAIGFDVRYHIETEVFSQKSKYQDIRVIENQSFGKMLFLDNDLQVAEADAKFYNESIVRPLVESGVSLDYVAILGGGDGGVLYEILKHNPGRVALIDIDEDVVSVAKTYLQEICHNAFDDPRVEVFNCDVIDFLDGSHHFDAIIYDLTMHPESYITMDWEVYLDQLFVKMKGDLKEGGMVTSQCCSILDRDTFRVVRKILNRHFSEVKFFNTYIPSYCTTWMFASCRNNAR